MLTCKEKATKMATEPVTVPSPRNVPVSLQVETNSRELWAQREWRLLLPCTWNVPGLTPSNISKQQRIPICNPGELLPACIDNPQLRANQGSGSP